MSRTDAGHGSAGSRKRGRRALALLAGCAAALVVAELVCRVDALFPGQPYDAERARRFLEDRSQVTEARDLEAFAAPDPQVTGASLRPMPHPWTGWSDPRSAERAAEAVRWFAGAEAERTFDLVVLGGSVAAQFANAAPDELARAIAESPRVAGRPVRVWNEGHAAYKAPQPLMLLLWLLQAGWRPDAVLLLDGFNEVAIAQSNAQDGAHPLYPFLDYWGTIARGGSVDIEALDLLIPVRERQRAIASWSRAWLGWGAHHSALLTRIAVAGVRARRAAFETARDRHRAHLARSADLPAIGGLEYDRDPAAVARLALRGWEESARALAAVCAARGIPCLQVIQPTLTDAGSKVPTEAETRAAAALGAWIDGVRRGYPELRAACARLEQEGLSVYDATRVFEREAAQVYVDVCHLDEAGYVQLARAIGPRLAARLAR